MTPPDRPSDDRLRSEWLSMVSHELRTPLTTIKEFTAILADGLAGPTTSDQQEYLKIIRGNVDRMARIVDDLLDISKIEAGRVLINKRFAEAAELIEQVVGSLKPMAESKQIQIALQLPQAPLAIFADTDKITQVLLNLVSNAIKFTPGPGRVTIGVDELENEIRFRVEDTGIGIAQEDLPKLFEKFQQFRRMPDVGSSEGTGLGLAISKRLVELHGGRIWAESQPGEGSTFCFALPKYHVEETLMEYLNSGIAQAKQNKTSLSLVVLAVVGFNELKARCGPEEAARFLKDVEQHVRSTIRTSAGDVAVRWQRGEMIVLLAEVSKAGCLAVAKRLRQAVEGRAYRVGQTEQCISVLMSTCTYPDEALNAEELLQAAEHSLKRVAAPRLRILVVDDEAKVRNFLKQMLEMRDFEVLTAASGPDALEQLKVQRVDLILLDLIMPVMDGYEVYHLLKEDPQTNQIPVLIVTARGERTDRRLGMDSPTYNYIAKPFQKEDLLAKIQELLKQHASGMAKTQVFEGGTSHG